MRQFTEVKTETFFRLRLLFVEGALAFSAHQAAWQ